MGGTSTLADFTQKRTPKQRGQLLARGRSGDAKSQTSDGRKTVVETLLEGEAEALTRQAIKMAREGDVSALRLCIERLLPPSRDRRIAFELPKVETAADALKASSAILVACAAGILSPSEARAVMDLVAVHVRTLEMSEIETRLIALEKVHSERATVS
jgi:hypothetical protein